ncbi:MAG: biotin--[acetyl-CoA-carboxylase] ligase [Phycisphaerae bacterium]|nr:biotin--[acetyl-CoA-carboxylase] ligase [Phycisphaerae bacterium]
MKLRLLKFLQERPQQWLAMEALCRELSAGPQQISKAIAELGSRGFHIDLSPVDGYRYVVSTEPLWDELLKPPGCRRLAKQVKLVQSTTSTNDLARRAAAGPANDGLAIFAEFQTAGRGRGGASWSSPAGMNLLFSVLLFDGRRRLKPHLLTLASGLALVEAVGEVTSLEPKLKWPNDLLIDSRKTAGILVEVCSDSSDTPALIIGVGLNCNCLPDELPNKATSLRQESGRIIDRHALARSILAHLEAWIDCCLSDRRQHIRQAYLQMSDLLGRTVQISCQGRRYSGRVVDLDPFQGILVQLDHGGVRLFSPATTSLLS